MVAASRLPPVPASSEGFCLAPAALLPVVEAIQKTLLEGSEAKPPTVEPPPPLQRLVKFRFLPDQALETFRVVVDTDEEFRERMISALDEEAVGEIGWLWLTKPDDWQQQVSRLVRLEEMEGLIRDALTRGHAHEDGLGQKETALRTVKAEQAKAKAWLDVEDGKVSGVCDEVAVTQAEADRAVALLRQAKAKARAATTERDRANRAWQRTTRKVEHRHHQIEALEAEIQSCDEEVRELTAAIGAVQEEEERRVAAQVQPPTEAPIAVPSVRVPSVRVPLGLPEQVQPDSREAAEFLLSVHGMTFLIDGYNVAFKLWRPDRLDLPEGADSLPDIRARLERRVKDLGTRYRAKMILVWDGRLDGPLYPASARRARAEDYLEVLFSPAGVKADDVIVETCGEYGPERQITVVSEDHAVRAGARRHGANVLHPWGLIASTAPAHMEKISRCSKQRRPTAASPKAV